ncbi:MAG: ABC transporter permease subunit [Saprospiraceae bacterium]|nr:ABC transporter permease subunit [Saprospiraceae bacterium]
MFLLQIRYEFLRFLRSPLAWLLLFVLALSVGFGLQNGRYRAAEKQTAIGKMLETQQLDLEKQKGQADSIARKLKTANGWWQDPTNVIVVGGMWRGGRVTAIEPTPQSVLATGMSDLHHNAWRLTLMGKEPWGGSELENPDNLAFGAFDLSFVLVYLLPLLVIAVSFNLISGEREQGTLALQLAQPQAAGRLFFHKMMARCTFLGALILAVVLPGLAMSGIALTTPAAWQTVTVALLYSLFWFLVALGINLRGGSSAQNALLCIGAWLLLTLIVPALASMLAEKIHPVPSRATFLNQLREADRYIESKREGLLDDFYKQHPSYTRKAEADKGWKDWYREDFYLYAFDQNIKDSIEQFYVAPAERQAAFAESLTLASPALSVHRQMTELARTSQRALKSIEPQLDEAQRNWAAWFMKKFEADQSLTPADYEACMRFPDRVQASTVPGGQAGLGWLVLQCLLAGAWAWWSSRRMPLIFN